MRDAATGVVIVDSKPSGAKVTIGDVVKTTPAKVDSLISGPCTVTLQHEGYEDFKTAINVDAKTPVDMGIIALVPETGTLSLTSPQPNVDYTLSGPGGYCRRCGPGISISRWIWRRPHCSISTSPWATPQAWSKRLT